MQACPALQDRLDQAWPVGTAPGADERMPVAEFLFSPANKRRIAMEMTPGRCKVRTYEVVYTKRRLESDLAENQDNPNCSASARYGNELTTYTLDTDVNLQSQELITVKDFEEACEDNASLLQQKVEAMMDQLRRGVATEVTTQAAALAGGWSHSLPSGNAPGDVNGSDEFVINTKIAGTDNPSPDAWVDLRNALDDSGFPADVLVAGGSTMRKYFQFLQAGCCADYGLDLGEIMAQYGYAFAYDKRLKTALGSEDKFMVFAPGALQVLNFSRAEGKAAMGEIWNAGSNYFYTVLRDPATGQIYDLTAKDDCGNLSLTLTWTGKVIGLPSDMFAIGDDYEGITYVAKGLVTNS